MDNSKDSYFYYLKILLLGFFPCYSLAADLTLTTWCGYPFSTSEHNGSIDILLSKSFAKIDTSIDIIHQPAERSLFSVSKGDTDGDFLRIAEIGEYYPNLIQVPVVLHNMEFVVFTKDINITIDNGWDSLAPYEIGIINGWKILEDRVPKTSKGIFLANQEQQLFTMLDKGRVDVVVYAKEFGLEVIKQLNLQDITIIDQPLLIKNMFLFLNKKHQSIIPSLTQAIEDTKREQLTN